MVSNNLPVYNKKIEKILYELGFKKSNFDTCVFFKAFNKSFIIILCMLTIFLFFQIIMNA